MVYRLPPIAWKVRPQSNPALVVVSIDIWRLKSPWTDTRDKGRLKHEGHGTTYSKWLSILSTSNGSLSYKSNKQWKQEQEMKTLKVIFPQANITSYVLVSGPCGVMQLCRLAPPGRNPSTLAYNENNLSNCILSIQKNQISFHQWILQTDKAIPHMSRKLNPWIHSYNCDGNKEGERYARQPTIEVGNSQNQVTQHQPYQMGLSVLQCSISIKVIEKQYEPNMIPC